MRELHPIPLKTFNFNWMKGKMESILKTVTVVVILMAFVPGINAQEDATLFFLPGISQSSLSNPAIQNRTDKLVVGIPFISGTGARWNASVPLNALFYDGFEYDVKRLYEALDETGTANASARLSMFFTSFQYNNFSFSFSVRERFFSEGVANREIARFIADGTAGSYGKNENFGAMTLFLTHYREVAQGFSLRLREDLDIGLRAKILFGKFHFSAKDLHFSAETDTEANEMLLTPEGSYFVSGPFVYSKNPDTHLSGFSVDAAPGDYFFKPKNLGIALDFGIIYRPNSFWELSASVLDAGMLGFRHKSYDVEFDRPIHFPEHSLYQSNHPEGAAYREPRVALQDIIDSVLQIISVKKLNTRNVLSLPVDIHFAARHNFNTKYSAGLHNQLSFYRLQPENMLSAFFTAAMSPKLDLFGSLSSVNFKNIMPGFGIVHTGGRVQIYFTSSNILSIIQPFASKQLNLSFGVNFLFATE